MLSDTCPGACLTTNKVAGQATNRPFLPIHNTMHFLPFKLRVLPRTLHFKQPAGTSRGIYRTRKVWYIVVTSTDPKIRFTGLGECAPLYDLSCDYDANYEHTLRQICAEVEDTQNLDAERWRDYPSVLFGLQTAFRSAAGSLQQGDYRKLYPSAFTRGQQGIPINGLVWMGSFEEMCNRMEEKLEKGFRCVKLKIGAIDFEQELELIRRLRSRYSREYVELRVDANGAFAPQDAPQKLELLSHYDIHSIEQPIRQGQWEEMRRLCSTTPLPIALDEELIGINTPRRKAELLDTIAPQYIILKPSLHGALTGAAEWMNLARERNIGYWVTSALESNVGLNAIAQWCAATQSDLTLPQGLGTGQLFVRNFEEIPLHVEGDCLWYGNSRQREFEKDIADFTDEWLNDNLTLPVHTSGSTGSPKPMEAGKINMWASARATIDALGLQPGNTALLAMPLRYIAGQMVVVRSFAAPLTLVPVAPTAHPYAHLHEAPDFAALTPMQVYESLKVPHERSLLRRTLCLIIGGGAVPQEVEQQLRNFPHAVWSTYGMTETLSHIALRRISGPQASDSYRPLPGVEITVTPEGKLQIFAPEINSKKLTTNDLAELLPDGSFRILGRCDNVICTGGIKLQIEEIESLLAALPVPCQITAVPDSKFGEAVTLLFTGDLQEEEVIQWCRERLEGTMRPKYYLHVDQLPMTENGKPARAAARELARLHFGR